MRRLKTSIMGSYIIDVDIYRDSRGFFSEVWNKKKFNLWINENINFFQENFSRSKKNVLRGLHFQLKKPQGKYISVIKGKIFDVAVDLRKNSLTFGKAFSITLSESNCRSVYIPPGFAHGFQTLDNENIVCYSCTQNRSIGNEHGLSYADPKLKIKWPKSKLIITKKDKLAKNFKELIKDKLI